MSIGETIKRIRASFVGTGDYIYPECPSCGTVAGKGEGVPLEMISCTPLGDFRWSCPECYEVHNGHYEPYMTEPMWTGPTTTFL